MNLDTALNLLSRIEGDRDSKSIFARANARYILFGVNEQRENFPKTLEYNLDIGSDSLAFAYLCIGCSLFEYGQQNVQMRYCLEKGAEFIEYNHLPFKNRNVFSGYYLLVSGLAYYAAGQYSKAFIIIKEAQDYRTDTALLCSAFLKKDFHTLNDLLNKILLDQEGYFNDVDKQITSYEVYQQVIIFAKAIANLMDYLYTGTLKSLERALAIQDDLLELLIIDQEPSMWWVVRMFKIITVGLSENSLWATIPFDPDSAANRKITNKYISNLVFGKKSIVELFLAQKQALPKIFSEEGAVVCLPTSSGKTQIASLSILQCLQENPNAKVLYLAPYRSLAFEVESTFKSTFEKLQYEVSQLYGTGQFSKLDRMVIADANILIATPEKAKVILRANEDIVQQIRLIIIDEGHLLDETERNVTNELYIEELKTHINRNGGKIILLSAVLPNSEDVAKWICGDEDAVVTGDQRLARQRLGILYFKNNSADIKWLGEEVSYNYDFIKAIPSSRKKGLTQPANKKMAVAMVAIRLSSSQKSLLLFTARAVSVSTYARAILKSIRLSGESLIAHSWINPRDWEEFQLICSEYDSKENRELIEFAKFGIVCHKGSLNKEVRATIEKLMRNGNPRIIVATMTLGQGVNLGVSTVILADTEYWDKNENKPVNLKSSEIWNIIGRAGRAFQDIEGKVLFAVEDNAQLKMAEMYMKNKPENTYSGLMLQIQRLKRIASASGVNFADLLEMIANNDYRRLNGDVATNEFMRVFDWIDDSLLSLSLLAEEREETIDDYFRSTLAAIQAKTYGNIDLNDVIGFLKARTGALRQHIIPVEQNPRKLITSSLPLASAIYLNEIFEEILDLGIAYLESSQNISDKIKLLKNLELLIAAFPSPVFHPKRTDKGKVKYPESLLDEARTAWISGGSLTDVSDVDKVVQICNHYYGYTITWVLGAIAGKCGEIEAEELQNLFEELAMCTELGLPDTFACKIYLSGIRSRSSARDLSRSINLIDFDDSIRLGEVRDYLLGNLEELLDEVENPLTRQWLQTLESMHNEARTGRVRKIVDFHLDSDEIISDRLYVKEYPKGSYFLCSADYDEKVSIESTPELPFKTIANRMDHYFRYDGENWKFKRAI